MKATLKYALGIILAIIMAVSSATMVAAENINPPAEEGVAIASAGSGEASPLAYQLVWKFKSSGGHMYKRRWNATLGCWYDPEWIFVE